MALLQSRHSREKSGNPTNAMTGLVLLAGNAGVCPLHMPPWRQAPTASMMVAIMGRVALQALLALLEVAAMV